MGAEEKKGTFAEVIAWQWSISLEKRKEKEKIEEDTRCLTGRIEDEQWGGVADYKTKGGSGFEDPDLVGFVLWVSKGKEEEGVRV